MIPPSTVDASETPRLSVPRPRNRKILAQRMPYPVVRHHDPRQIGMVQKTYSEKIEHFALIPVGRAIDSERRFDFRVFARTSRAFSRSRCFFAIDCR